MPELPDIVVTVESIERLLVGQTLEKIRIVGPSLLRSVTPAIRCVDGKRLLAARRIGKRIVFELDDDLFLVFHLMIAGRFRLRRKGAAVSRKLGLCALDFERGSLILSEASSRKRASLYLIQGEAGLAEHDPGGLEVLEASLAAFRERLLCENHTLKRALTDPHLFSGIGNAYSDEILHAAGLSPVRWTSRLDDDQIESLYEATRATLEHWTTRLREEVGDGFHEKVTAFRDAMAAHGRHGKPCPRCDSPIQRIVYASNETNYCATCQTDGKLLADRALSRLLKKDWPRSLEELEAHKRERSGSDAGD